MPHKDTSNKQSRSCILPCLTQIPTNHRQQSVLAMPSRIPANHRQQMPHTDANKMGYIYIYIFNLAIPHMDTSKSQATNTISYHGSYTYQKFTGSKKVILPCLTHIPANHRKKSYIVPCLRYQQITGNKAHLLCLSRKLANHRQQIVHLPIASHRYQKITGNKSYTLVSEGPYRTSRGQRASHLHKRSKLEQGTLHTFLAAAL